MVVDKHKVWLIIGIVIVVLVVGVILIYPSLTNKTVAGQASALMPNNPSGTGTSSPTIQLPSCLNLQKLNVKDKPNVDSARARRGIICTSAQGCTYNKGSTPESDQCVGIPSTCPASIQSWSYSNAADNTARKETCESLTALKCDFKDGSTTNVNDYKDLCVPHTEGSSTPPPKTETEASAPSTATTTPESSSVGTTASGEICTNTHDDDKDGMVDCKDADCASDANCPKETGDACTSAALPLKRINNVYHKCAQWGKVGLMWLVYLNGPCSVDSQCIPNTACEGSKCLGKEGIACSLSGKPNNALCANGYTCDVTTKKCVAATTTKTVPAIETATTTTGTTTGTTTTTTTMGCVDADKTYDPYLGSGEQYTNTFSEASLSTKSSVTDSTGTLEDSCDGFEIREAYCKTGIVKESLVTDCPDGKLCQEGACVSKSTIPCKDTEVGLNPTQKGTVTSGSGTVFDSCEANGYLTEKSCGASGKDVVTASGPCSSWMDSWTQIQGHSSYWCENGACVTKMCVDGDNTYAPSKSGHENTFSQNSLSQKNKVVGVGPGGNLVEEGWSDFCSSDGIQEYYCNTENVIGVDWWKCPTGTTCTDGACVVTNVVTDLDSDSDGIVDTNDICPTIGETGKVYSTGNMNGCWYGDLDHDGCVGDENIAAAIDLFYVGTLTDDQIAVAVDMALSGKGCKNQ